MQLALDLVDLPRVAEIYAGIAAALALGGQPDQHRLAERATAVTEAADNAGTRTRGFARLALAAHAGRHTEDAVRFALAAKDASTDIHGSFDSGAYAEAARALAVAGFEDDAIEAAKTAFFRSIDYRTAFYPWWGRTLVYVLGELGACGVPEASEIAASIPVIRWRDMTLPLLRGTGDLWDKHDWREHGADLGNGRILDYRTAEPGGQEESLEHIAIGLGAVLRAGGRSAEILLQLCSAVTQSRPAWIDLLPIAAYAEPDGIKRIADHAAQAWNVERPHLRPQDQFHGK
jgi:hypothetical protein